MKWKTVFIMWFKFLILLFVLHLTNTEGLDRSGWPGYEHYPSINGWLKLHKMPTEYQDARMNCHMEDAVMAAEWSLEFTASIKKIMTSLGNEDQSPAVYSGAQVTFSDGVYRYVKGEPTLSLGADVKLERCIVFSANGSTVEVDCQEKFPYVCYAPVPACGENDTLAKYDLTCAGYKFASQTGHCYKFHTESKNWTESYSVCRKEGAHLAIVNSGTEAQFLKGLFPSGGANIACIGFYYWKPSGSWWTIHGLTIQQAGFTSWRSGEPTSGTHYGFLHREGTLYSHSLSVTASFICEKPPALKLFELV